MAKNRLIPPLQQINYQQILNDMLSDYERRYVTALPLASIEELTKQSHESELKSLIQRFLNYVKAGRDLPASELDKRAGSITSIPELEVLASEYHRSMSQSRRAPLQAFREGMTTGDPSTHAPSEDLTAPR